MPCRLGGTVPLTNKRGINKKRRYGEVSTNPQQGRTCQFKQQQYSPQKSHDCPPRIVHTLLPGVLTRLDARTCTGGRHRIEFDLKGRLLVLRKRQFTGQTTKKEKRLRTPVRTSGSTSSGGASTKRKQRTDNNLRLPLCRRPGKGNLLLPPILGNRKPQLCLRRTITVPKKHTRRSKEALYPLAIEIKKNPVCLGVSRIFTKNPVVTHREQPRLCPAGPQTPRHQTTGAVAGREAPDEAERITR